VSVAGSKAPLAVVELYTSEGCSSCPSADRVFAKIVGLADVEKKNVFTLAFHVDYWNGLGWRDRFSDRAYSERQRWYARHDPQPRLYTPQMIVHGETRFVGNQEARAFEAVKAALSRPPAVEVALLARQTGAGFEVDYRVLGASPDDRLNLALVQRRASTTVEAGENAGETLTHVSIVRDHAERRLDTGEGVWRVAPENSEAHAVVLFVQDPESLQVLVGNRLTLEPASGD
jgi:hypothetical protein